jgi:tRNA(fMet)-specific endonuclease VapC
MTLYMLDTDTSSYIIRDKPASVRERFAKIDSQQICISVVTYAELLYGVKRSSSSKVNRPIVENYVRHLVIQPWDEMAADHYSTIRTLLESSGQPIGGMDTQIAAHALSLDAVLVTNNTRHFERVPGLKLENWVDR